MKNKRTESPPIEVSQDVVDETIELAHELLREGKYLSFASALQAAARTIAAKYTTMPGPIVAAIRVAEMRSASEDLGATPSTGIRTD